MQRLVADMRTRTTATLWLAVAVLGFGALLTTPTPSFAAPRRRALTTSRHSSRAERRRIRWRKPVDPHLSVARVNRQLEQLASKHKDVMSLKTVGHVGEHPVYRVDIKPRGDKAKRVLVTGGVHGNEPTGVLTALDLVKRAVKDKGLRSRAQLTVIPMVNPIGLHTKQRRNGNDVDVNRTFVRGKWQRESRIVARAIRGQRFDLAVDLHGAGKNGFFLIRAKEDAGMSTRILGAMSSSLLLGGRERSSYLGSYNLDAPGAATSNNPGTLKGYMSGRGTRYAYTLEYPRTISPRQQRSGLMRLLRSAIDNVAAHGD